MTLLGLFLTALLGWLLAPRKLGLGLAGGLGAGFALVAFGLSAELFFLGLAGLGWNPWVLLLPWVAGAAWKVSRERPDVAVAFHWSDGLALGAAAVALAVWLPYERLMPLTSRAWDTWAIWLFKSKAFYLDGDVTTYLSRAAEFTGQPGYPLLTPLYGTFLYGLSGGVDDQAAKLMTPAYWLALLGVFHALATKLTTRVIAGGATAILALTPMLQRVSFELAGYADVPLALYAVAAGGFLALWDREGEASLFAAASLAATAAAWTKNEGQLLLAVFGAAAIVLLVRRKAPAVCWGWLAAPPAALLGAWSIVRSGAAVEAAGFTPLVDFHAGLFSTALGAMVAKAVAPSSFLLAFPAFAAAVAALAVKRAPLRTWISPAFVAAMFGGALLAYATGRNEIQWWLETSADRLLTQSAPLCLLAVATAFGVWADAEPETAQPVARAAPSPRKGRKNKR